jgi:acyl-CoA reductase-like NAD-dependent aldehyde dehydrogenase
MIHIPLLRRSRPYRSLEIAKVPHYRSKEPVAEVSQANPGLLRRDLLDQEGMRRPLLGFSTPRLFEVCAAAARHFTIDALPLGDETQTPEDYVRQTSSTTGLPHVMVRRNMQKIEGVLAKMPEMLAGLTRSIDPELLDRGIGEAGGHALSFVPRTAALGVVLPSNSPGVHSLWAPAIALKTALVLKPGGSEPWTPYRIIQAFLKAGAPPEAFGFYPTDHAGAAEILRHCGRGMVFGDVSSIKRWAGDPRVEVHGPGYSKVLLGPDACARWEKYLDVMVTSILENSGRSCVNASGVWVTSHAREIAEALAERLAAVKPRAAEDPGAEIAPFATPGVAERISALVDQGLAEPGARDVSAAHRPEGRVAVWDGSTYLLPTIVLCDSADHPLANREFLFPFASVVTVKPEEIPDRLGPTLALTAITEDQALVRRILASPHVHRLNLGPIATPRVSWDQPHEGNLFEHLYVRRAFQKVG